MTSRACKVFHKHSLFGPAQRNTHFKGVGLRSNAVGAGRWWMYTTLSPWLHSLYLWLFSCLCLHKPHSLQHLTLNVHKWARIRSNGGSNKLDVGTCVQSDTLPCPFSHKIIWMQGMYRTMGVLKPVHLSRKHYFKFLESKTCKLTKDNDEPNCLAGNYPHLVLSH